MHSSVLLKHTTIYGCRAWMVVVLLLLLLLIDVPTTCRRVWGLGGNKLQMCIVIQCRERER